MISLPFLNQTRPPGWQKASSRRWSILLHSRPEANRIIFLDFDGFTISGTAWNVDNGGADIVAPPCDTDGNPSTFGSSERTAIQQIWLRVSEDFAPFDVDVTTEYPGEAALPAAAAATKSSACGRWSARSCCCQPWRLAVVM
jgi:hypothetical protein